MEQLLYGWSSQDDSESCKCTQKVKIQKRVAFLLFTWSAEYWTTMRMSCSRWSNSARATVLVHRNVFFRQARLGSGEIWGGWALESKQDQLQIYETIDSHLGISQHKTLGSNGKIGQPCSSFVECIVAVAEEKGVTGPECGPLRIY